MELEDHLQPARLLKLLAFVAVSALSPLQAQQPAAVKAATELLALVHMRDGVVLSMKETYAVAVMADSTLRPLQLVMDRFFADSATWHELEPRLARFYATRYTLSELDTLNAFLRTPLGQKFYAQAPDLMKESQAIWQQVIDSHQADLTQQVTAETQRLQVLKPQ